MGKNDLIERYIYAVTKHMKTAMQKDVAKELETIIQDMLEERCEDVIPTEHDVKVILTELGTPAELASKYKGETQDCLIVKRQDHESQFFENIKQLFGENTEVIPQVFIQFNKVFLAIIIFALGIDCIDTIIKALKYSRNK